MTIIPYSKWLGTSLGTRVKIAQQFGIAKLRSTHVSNDVVIDDGYNLKDIENALSLEAMQSFTGLSTDNVLDLFKAVVDKMEGKELSPSEESVPPLVETHEEALVPIKEPVTVKKVIKKKVVKKKK